MNSAPLDAATRVGRSLSAIMNIHTRGVVVLAVLLGMACGAGEAMTLNANTSFTSGGNAVNWVDAALGSSATPRSFVNSQSVGVDFAWLPGPTLFGLFYGRTSFDSGFGGPISVQAMGFSCHRPVLGNVRFGLRSGDGIVNGPGMNNASVVLFEFFTRIPLGFAGVSLEIAHQMLVSVRGYSTPAVFHGDHVGISVGGGAQ